MPNIKLIHDFFFGNPQQLGIDTMSPEEILELMKANTNKEEPDEFPYAIDVGLLLFNQKNNDDYKIGIPNQKN